MTERTNYHTPSRVPTSTFQLSTFKEFLFKSTKVRIVVSLWVLGLIIGLLVPGTSVTNDMKERYNEKVIEAATIPGYDEALNEVLICQENLYDSKVWFWRFRSEYAKRVRNNQLQLEIAEQRLNDITSKRDAIISDAKHDIGIFSEYALEEAREKFWNAFEHGKVFAKRQTFWDTIFRLMASRDDSVLSFAFQWLLTACMNFTLGLIGSLFYYGFSLFSMIWTYQPDPFSAIVFYLLAFLSAGSIVAAYLIGIYGLAAGSVYVFGRVLYKSALKDQERRRHLHYN